MSADATLLSPEPDVQAMRTALAFLHESGVDSFTSDSPRNWLVTPPAVAAPAQAQAAPAPRANAPRAKVTTTATDLEALAAEVAAYPHPLNPGMTSGEGAMPCLLEGPEQAELLLLTETSLSPDSESARLISAMMAAIGLNMAQLARVPLIPWPTSGGRAARPEELADFAPFASAAVRLARPRLVLAFGPHLTAPLVSAAPRPGDWHNLGELPLLTTLSPALLLRSPALKAEAWAHLQALAERLS